jgi:outer membrane protein OmpA-like peptidoglycan-associated protein
VRVSGRPIVGVVLVTLLTGCASTGPVVVLLPDEEGTVGRAIVSNGAGEIDLHDARGATRIAATQAPSRVKVMKEADVERLYGETLRFLPAPPIRFTLFFQFDSDVLTEESQRLVPQILSTSKQRAAREVTVVGHTDTMGTTTANFALGLKRATAVRSLLIAAGLDRSIVDATSLGESYPLVRTADQTPEPQNRRVEIVVRPEQR